MNGKANYKRRLDRQAAGVAAVLQCEGGKAAGAHPASALGAAGTTRTNLGEAALE